MTDVIVVGGGFAGMQTALTLKDLGLDVLLIEKDSALGGHVKDWHTLFPDISSAEETLDGMVNKFRSSKIPVMMNTEVTAIKDKNVTLASGEVIPAKSVVLCTGYELFDARLKQEYGYGLYDRVITSADLEKAFKNGRVDEIARGGANPKTIAFVHCVGSRDQQVRQEHCSRVCCVCGVKQAIKIRKTFPGCEVYNFYMDIRMFGAGYEEMYRTAQQEHHVHFIRGRVSEVTPNIDGSVLLKTEDTLLARPMRMSVDLLVLMVGMCANPKTVKLAEGADIEMRPSGFLKPVNPFGMNTRTSADGIFMAGCAAAPHSVQDTINSATHAAYEVMKYLKN